MEVKLNKHNNVYNNSCVKSSFYVEKNKQKKRWKIKIICTVIANKQPFPLQKWIKEILKHPNLIYSLKSWYLTFVCNVTRKYMYFMLFKRRRNTKTQQLLQRTCVHLQSNTNLVSKYKEVINVYATTDIKKTVWNFTHAIFSDGLLQGSSFYVKNFISSKNSFLFNLNFKFSVLFNYQFIFAFIIAKFIIFFAIFNVISSYA